MIVGLLIYGQVSINIIHLFFKDFQTYCNIFYGYVQIDGQDNLIVSELGNNWSNYSKMCFEKS